MMTLTQLQVFRTVAETNSFTRAADRLGITQSGASHAIAALEAELGVRLLKRDREGVTLTEAGALVLSHVDEIVYRLERLRDVAGDLTGLKTGKLRIGSFPSVSARLLPSMIGSFKRRYPGVEVVLFEGSDPEVVDWLRSGTVDVAVVNEGMAGLPPEQFEVVPMATDMMVALVSARHPLAGRAAITVNDLAAEPFIMSKGGCEPLIHQMFAAASLTPATPFRVQEAATILAMVQEGLGVTIVPELVVPDGYPGVQVLRLEPSTLRKLGLVARRKSAASPAVAAFLRLVRLRTHPAGRSGPQQ